MSSHSDASTVGYGQCSYLRLTDQQRFHFSLVMAKSRVALINPVTIPGLELTAALVSVKVSSVLLEELVITKITEWFWTDSNVVVTSQMTLRVSMCLYQTEYNRSGIIRNHFSGTMLVLVKTLQI